MTGQDRIEFLQKIIAKYHSESGRNLGNEIYIDNCYEELKSLQAENSE